MTYSIKLTNQNRLVDIPDGAVDTASTSINLVGRNVAGYGSYQNANFVAILENFANNVAPDSPLEGQIWYDSVNKQLKVFTKYDTLPQWKGIAIENVSPTKPDLATSSIGDIWYNTDSKQMFTFNGLDYDIVGTSVPGFGKSRLEGGVIVGIKDGESVASNNPVLRLFLDDALIAIISKFEFTPLTPIAGLHQISNGPIRIVPGINMVGPTLLNGSVDQSHTLIDQIDGPLPSTSFVRTNSLTEQVISSSLRVDNAVSVGVDSVLTAKPYTGPNATENVDAQISYSGTKLVITNDSTTAKDILTLENTNPTTYNLSPSMAIDTVNLGTVARPFDNIWATSVIASVTGNVTGNVVGSLTGQIVRTDTLAKIDGTTVIDNTNTVPVITGNLVGDVDANLISTNTLGVDGNLTVTGDINTVSLNATGGVVSGLDMSASTISNTDIVDSNITNATILDANLSGVPVAVTANVNVNSTRLATTEFVHNVLPYGAIIMWHGPVGTVPAGWALCDGDNNTPDLRDKFVRGAGGTGHTLSGTTGGSTTVIGTTTTSGSHSHAGKVGSTSLSESQIPSHRHNFDDLYGLRDDRGPKVYDRNGVELERYTGWGSDGDADSGDPIFRAWRTDAVGGVSSPVVNSYSVSPSSWEEWRDNLINNNFANEYGWSVITPALNYELLPPEIKGVQTFVDIDSMTVATSVSATQTSILANGKTYTRGNTAAWSFPITFIWSDSSQTTHTWSVYPFTETISTGGAEAHTHDLNINNTGEHMHVVTSTNVLPPFYALCYIMKIN